MNIFLAVTYILIKRTW